MFISDPLATRSGIPSGLVSAVVAVLVPEPLEDTLGGVALLPGAREIVFQNPVDDADVGLLLSLSKGWDAGAGSVAGTQEARSGPASCAPCPGADRTPGLLPARSSHPPSPPGEPADHTSTLYIRRTIHGVGYNPMNDGGRYSI